MFMFHRPQVPNFITVTCDILAHILLEKGAWIHDRHTIFLQCLILMDMSCHYTIKPLKVIGINSAFGHSAHIGDGTYNFSVVQSDELMVWILFTEAVKIRFLEHIKY